MLKRNRRKRDGPGPVDAFVGRQIRDRRISLGLGLKELAPRLRLSPQQLQKYERGVHRIYASRLWAISQALGVPVEWFFKGYGDEGGRSKETEIKRTTLQLIQLFLACPPAIQENLLALFKATAEMRNK